MIFIFLNTDLAKIVEAGRTEDENQEHLKIKNTLKGRVKNGLAFLIIPLLNICHKKHVSKSN